MEQMSALYALLEYIVLVGSRNWERSPQEGKRPSKSGQWWMLGAFILWAMLLVVTIMLYSGWYPHR